MLIPTIKKQTNNVMSENVMILLGTNSISIIFCIGYNKCIT